MEAIERRVEIRKIEQTPFVSPHLPAHRSYRHIRLVPKEGRDIELFMSLPERKSDTPLPVVMVLGGWDVKRETLGLVSDPGAYILVVYRYGYGSDIWKKARNKAAEVFRVREAILSVPARVLEAIEWLRERKEVDKERVVVMGVSLGALFVPSLYHLAQRRGVVFPAGVIAFGGADLQRLISENIVRFPPVARVLATMLHPVEPSIHLPALYQPILFINGREDRLIPTLCARKLHAAKPEPKTVVWLETRHIQPDRKEIVQKVVEITTEWLLRNGILRKRSVRKEKLYSKHREIQNDRDDRNEKGESPNSYGMGVFAFDGDQREIHEGKDDENQKAGGFGQLYQRHE